LIATRRDGFRRLATNGLGRLTPEEGTLALEHVLAAGMGHALVTRLDMGRWAYSYPAGTRSLLRDLPTEQPTAADSDDVVARLRATPHSGRPEILETWLREQIGKVLRTSTASVATSVPLKAMGLDSLLSLELRQRLEKALGIALPVTAVWNYPTVAALSGHLGERLNIGAPDGGSVPVHANADDIEDLLREVEGLSEHDVQRILNEGDLV
jgi:acyl carrier protein